MSDTPHDAESPEQLSIGRRRFLKMIPAAAVAVPALAQQPPGREPAARIDKTTLDVAENVIGLDFSAPEEELALRGANRNLEDYEQLRKIDIPLDTEPAFAFHPYLPGKRPKPGATPGAPLKVPKPALPVFSAIEDLAFVPATTMGALIQARKVTSTDVTRMYLDRLKRFGDKLLCVVTLTEDLALLQAAEADREIAAGKVRGPLHGVPWGAKDLFATRGIPTTWGAEPYMNQVFDYDATIVARLRAAGAVLVAKLSMGALAQGGVWFKGSTKNPWSVERSSSGSSAGPGSATAAGLVGFGMGTETRGSIISPSSTCGVVGLRPTYGRVSRFGAMALSWTMDKIGPMCRTVEDCAAVFNAVYGPDGQDEAVVDAPFVWNPEAPLSSIRIGYVKAEFESMPANPSAEARKAREARNAVLGQALDALRNAGAKLEPMELPDFNAGAIGFVLSAEAAAAFDDLTRSRGIDQLRSQGPGDWPNTFRTSRFIPAVEYIRAQRARTLLMRAYDELMGRYDVFLSPSQSASLGATNLTGHPALAMKAGFVDGLPVALMITGRLWDEATVLRVALAYQRATKWHEMNPKLQ
jgi:Asp-tRNA(Asn)/Glu-tRNA(Gln) amidotransferase A subunit family amidase